MISYTHGTWVDLIVDEKGASDNLNWIRRCAALLSHDRPFPDAAQHQGVDDARRRSAYATSAPAKVSTVVVSNRRTKHSVVSIAREIDKCPPEYAPRRFDARARLPPRILKDTFYTREHRVARRLGGYIGYADSGGGCVVRVCLQTRRRSRFSDNVHRRRVAPKGTPRDAARAALNVHRTTL